MHKYIYIEQKNRRNKGGRQRRKERESGSKEERRNEGKLKKNHSGKTRKALGHMFLFENCWKFGSEFT